ncbi:DNA ligase [Salinivibrio sp. IB868]|uniref:DNA ligase n=1 Tax=unclassified Salinivibrio TaxID=2636825 RepID=UPI00098460B2|nr:MULTISPECIES: DNA ligase [unclassified Salinivibrio]OOE69525.1 DNA ligase [Salinivibrio sp. IB868]OOE71321.1 DNA ligase [Salinivibrio sp. IB870]
MARLNPFTLCLLSAFTLFPTSDADAAPSAPALMHGIDGQIAEQDYRGYWASEKLDGIRAYWTGSRLLTRQGNPIHAPEAFIQSLPQTPLDGELWAGRGEFQAVLRTVLDDTPDEDAWQRIRFYAFDMPDHSGQFSTRYTALKQIVSKTASPHLAYVPQKPVTSNEALKERLATIDEAGGEGLMLHHPDSVYVGQRVESVVKLKTYQEKDVTVVGMNPGKGRLQGLMGSLVVRLADGTEFSVGSGFSDAQRADPPQVGSTILVRHNGVTQKGIPRFARFIREKPSL